jgi:apolipoprotein N-acyltransferase
MKDETVGGAGAKSVGLGSKLLRLWPWLAAVCTGLLCTACFPPFNLWWLCWIALTPLLTAIWFSGENSSRRGLRDLLLGYAAGLAFFWTIFSWLTTVTVLGWFLLQFYMAIYFALWGWLAGALRPRAVGTPRGVRGRCGETSLPSVAEPRKPWDLRPRESPLAASPWLRSTNNLRLAFLLACGWVAQELLRSIVFSGWGWNTLGTALHAQWALIQITEVTGVAGLSFVVVFANVVALATVRRFILETQVRPVRPHFDLTLTLTGIVGLMAFGIHAVQVPRPTKPLRVALVQANVAREEKFDASFAQTIFDKFRRLSTPAVESTARPDLLVWPESSTPMPVLADEETYRFVTDFSASAKTDLLLGTIDLEEKRAYNAALLVSEGGKKIQLYRKVHLVPFGEYIPGRHWIPLLAQIVGDQVPDDFAFGKEHTVFRLTNGGVAIAPLICFEDTIGDLTRRFVLRGAALLANVTNDGWFKESAGSQQHLANAVFRCVETRRPMVRAANTGVTCVINEAGRVTQMLVDENGSQFTQGVLTSEIGIPTSGELTFYVRHGELFAYACAAMAGLTLIYIVVFARRRRSAVAAAKP